MEDWVEIELARIIIQQKGDQQYLHLRERHGDRSFPIVIGFNEIEEINRKLRKVAVPRPLTHDLIGRVLQAAGHRIRRVIITELRDATFYANLVLEDDAGEEKNVDCRPSDAIALAVQVGAPMFVARDVFDVVAPQ